MSALRSSPRSVTIQSILRGRTALSLETSCLPCDGNQVLALSTGQGCRHGNTNLAEGHLEQHVARTLDAEELARDEDRVHVNLTQGAIGRGARGRLAEITTQDPLQRRRKIDVCRGLLLDRLQHTPLPACDDGMERVLDFARLGMQTALCIMLAVTANATE